jgi:hypothetical protein
MRSAGLFAVLIGLILVTGSGCRELSTENADRNRAPETYLSAAPVDSIGTVQGQPPNLTRIAHRYRANWSGADVDGEVVGFFVAVTETTVEAATGRPFRLPPPRPSQYKFTTARESLFVFSILEGRGSDRQHALYVYAVDNQGRVDPTPAVTHFVTRDQNLPTIRFLRAEATGTIYESDGAGGVVPVQFHGLLEDDFEVPAHPPADTIPVGGAAYFAWKGEDADFASAITGYLYRLTESELVRVDSTVTTAEYGTGFGPSPGPIPVGPSTFRIRAIDEAGGTTQPDAVRQIYVNFSPDTWFAGPDPVALASHLLVDSLGSYLPGDSLGANLPFDFPGNPFGEDTLQTLPAERKAMDGLDPPFDPGSGTDREFRPKTFLMGRTLLDGKFRWYIAQENDTVAFGSRLAFRLGGFDRDSPYNVRGGTPDNVFPVLRSGPLNGSPVSFQARLAFQSLTGGAIQQPFTTPFPNVDVLDPFGNPTVLFHVERVEAVGRGFVQIRAVDGNRTSDGRIGDPVLETDHLSTAMRSKVLTFFINHRPGLVTVSPVENEVLNPPGDRVTLIVRATDPDPDPDNPPSGGSPYTTMYFAIRARIYSPSENPADNQGWQDPNLGYHLPDVTTPGVYPYSDPISLELVVPPDLPTGPAILEYEVVDNANRGLARVIHVKVPIYWRVGP